MAHAKSTAPAGRPLVEDEQATLDPKAQQWLPWYRLAVIFASFGINATFFVPLQNLLPRMVEGLTQPGDKGIALGIITGLGALIALVANPIAGHFSDKRVHRDGRRSWIIAGLVLGTCSLLLLSVQHSLWGIGVLWACAQLTLNFANAPMVASVVDHTPADEQGTVWGYIGMARAIGLIVGFTLLAIPPSTIASGMTAIAVLYAFTILPLALVVGKAPLVPQLKHPKKTMTKLAILESELARDFRDLLAVRLFLSLASAITLTYLLYYLQDVIHYARPTEGQTILILLSTIATVVAAITFGKLSDKTGQRRRYIAQGTALIIIAGIALAIFPTWPTTIFAALAIGVATGAFSSAGQALTVRTLPDPNSAGRDLGIMNIGSVLPQAIGPLLGSLLIYLGVSYRGLFLVASLLGLIALAILRNIRDQS